MMVAPTSSEKYPSVLRNGAYHSHPALPQEGSFSMGSSHTLDQLPQALCRLIRWQAQVVQHVPKIGLVVLEWDLLGDAKSLAKGLICW